MFPVVALLLLAVGCGGGTPAPRMPTGGDSWLALVPRDAVALVRVEVAAIRETPHMAELLAEANLAPEAEEPAPPTGMVVPPVGATPLPVQEGVTGQSEQAQIADYISRIDRVAFAMGGPMPTPYNPERHGELTGEARQMHQALSFFGDQVPTVVAVVQGDGASDLCAEGFEQNEARELNGYTVGINDEAAFLLRGDVCTITLRGAYSGLLEHRSEPLPYVASLAAPVPHGGYVPEGAERLFSMAMDHGSEGARRLWEAWRAADQAAAAAAAQAEQDEEGAGNRMGRIMREYDEIMRRVRIAYRVVLQALNEHVVSATSSIWRSPTGYHIHSRSEYDDDDRATMWREWALMYAGIGRGLISEGALPDEINAVVQPVMESVQIQEEGDSLHIGYSLSDAWLADVRRRVEEARSPAVRDESPDGPRTPTDEYRMMIDAAQNSDANAVIEALHDKQAQIAALDHYPIRNFLVQALAEAYADRGRYADAAALLQSNRPRAGQGHNYEIASELRFYDEVNDCQLLATETRIHLEYGRAAEAEAAIAAVQAGCRFPNDVLTNIAFGRLDEAATQLATGRGRLGDLGRETMLLATARGNAGEASAISAALCRTYQWRDACGEFAGEFVETRVRGAQSIDSVLPMLQSFQADHPADAHGVRAVAAECALRQRHAARDEQTEAACRRAVDIAVQVHSEQHPRTAMARMALAETLQTRRDRSGAASQREAAAPVIETLGARHPLRVSP